MKIHKPKTAHSLREFATELLSIVAAIIIAIALEQTVEAIHWRHWVAAARESLRRPQRQSSWRY